MTALAYVLAGIIATQLGLIAWLVYGRIADSKALATERMERVNANTRAERAEYELAAATKKIAEQDETIEVLAQEDYEVPTDLDPGDWRARVQLAAQAAAARRGALPAGADGDEVHPSGPADGADAAEVPAGEVRPDGLMQP